MRNRPLRCAWLGALAVAFMTAASIAVAAPAAPTVTDLLDQSAKPSVRAQRSVLLAVGRADKRLVAVGEAGIVLLSDNNGGTWRQARVPTSVALTNVCFVSASQGWAVGHGGVVLKSSDGGESWVKQLDGREAARLEAEAARAEAAKGIPGADLRLREAERQMREGPDKPLLDVHFFDERSGLVVGAYGLIFATSDGGRSWQPLKSRLDNPKGVHLYSIQAAGSDVFIAGEQGALYRTSDRANTFVEVKTPYVGTYFGALAPPNGVLFAFGLRGNAYRSVDRGANWQKVDMGPPVTLTAGTLLRDGSVVLADETGRVLRSTDGGLHFAPLPVPQPSPFTGVVEAADGSLVLSGARGMARLAFKMTNVERQQ